MVRHRALPVNTRDTRITTQLRGGRWQASAIRDRLLRSLLTTAPMARQPTATAWVAAQELTQAASGRWHGAPLRQLRLGTAWRESQTRGQPFDSGCASAVLLALDGRVPWCDARARGGLSWPWPPLPPWSPWSPRATLRFHFHPPVFAPLRFHFGRAPAWVIPILRSYRMVHDLEVVRLPDRTAIPVTALTLSSAWDEWAWSLSATLAGAEAI